MALAQAIPTGSRLYPSLATASPTDAVTTPPPSHAAMRTKPSPLFGATQKQCVSIDPNTLFRTYTHIGYGQDFKVFEPLVEGQTLNFWQKLALAPIHLYQQLTRFNKTATGSTFRKISDGCPFIKTHDGRKASCSEYTALAIKFYGQTGLIGTIKGGLTGLWRICHCNPFIKKKVINGSYADPQWKVCLPGNKAAQWDTSKKPLSVQG